VIDGLPDNVFYDSASAYAWADLNETAFLERVLDRLRALMGEQFSDYAFFVLSSHRGDVRPDSASHAGRHKVLIFMSEERSVVPVALQEHYHAIFKAYLPHEMPGTNIFPFNIGYVRDVPAYPVRPTADRATDVFFSGNLSLNRLSLYRSLHPTYRRLPISVLRLAFVRCPGGLAARVVPRDLSRVLPSSLLRFSSGFKDGLSPEDYGRELADSRIVLCPMGAHSPETFRHIEAMRAGAVIFSEPLPDTHFYRGSPLVVVDDWRSGINRVKQLLSDEAALAAIQRDTVTWWQTVCSEAATAAYVRDRLLEL
jgi:hypothetical protein